MLDLEVQTAGVAGTTSPRRRSPKRKTKRRASSNVGLNHMPSEVLEAILFSLDPQSVTAVTSVCKRFVGLGTPRFWKSLLGHYWTEQMTFPAPVSTHLALSKTQPAPQIHFVSHHHFALGIQEVAQYAEWLTESEVPFEGCTYLGLTLPHLSTRNALASFYPNRQFYLAAYGSEHTRFNFSTLILSAPKPSQQKTHVRRSSRDKPQPAQRHFFPIGIKLAEEQKSFLDNFKGVQVTGATNAMLLAQCISTLFVSAHVRSTLGRLTFKVPGVSTLPPPKDVDKFYIRSSILIAKIPSLCLEFKFSEGALVDLRMHGPSQPWEFV